MGINAFIRHDMSWDSLLIGVEVFEMDALFIVLPFD